MKKHSFIFRLLGLILLLTGMQSCIYDYPHASRGHSPGIGEDPTTVDAYIDVDFDISWESMLHNVNLDYETKAATQRPHRIIIEVLDGDMVLCHDVEYLNANEFANGRLLHRLSVPLEAKVYQIAAWYDRQDENGKHSFSADDLSKIGLINTSTTNVEDMQCAYARDTIDLMDYGVSEEISITKTLSMKHSGARFEIVATDVNQFIADNREALFQDDKFTVHLYFSYGTSSSFNTYSESIRIEEETLHLSGRMRLPFAEYDELKIAEGFLFCQDQDEITAKLSVTNSALVTVAQTKEFNFPVKRGYITIISGDFLTNSVDGVFSVDNLWDDEIIIEI